MYMQTLVEHHEGVERAAWRKYPDHRGLERIVQRALLQDEQATVRDIAGLMRIRIPSQQLKFRLATLIFRNRPR